MQKANSVDPDQTAPLGAVGSGSALFAQTVKILKFRTPEKIDVITLKFEQDGSTIV